MSPATPSTEWPDTALLLMAARRTILPKRLVAPGPNAAQLHQLFTAAATAPDHDQVQPWRFVVIPDTARASLADVFGQALRDRDAQATDAQVEQAREKAFRAPLLLLLVVDGNKGDPSIDVYERMVSAGAAVQSLLLMATAQGFGSALTSGKALRAESFRRAFALADGEFAPCFISIGTVSAAKAGKPRPEPASFVSTWAPATD
jgi:nitroreductase